MPKKVLWVAVSKIVTAFNRRAIGTKVIDRGRFEAFLDDAIRKTDFSKGKTPGQALVRLPREAFRTVSCGVGKRTLDPDDYVPALHRGHVGLYLRRHCAAEVKSLHVVVYTWDAYKADPDVDLEEIKSFRVPPTHVIVAVLASANNKPRLSPGIFVHNLAGGNNDFKPGKVTVKELIGMAKDIEKYHNDWCTVADGAPIEE